MTSNDYNEWCRTDNEYNEWFRTGNEYIGRSSLRLREADGRTEKGEENEQG